MSDNQKKTAFQYTFSAKEQEELKRIRDKYLPKQENKMELLRRLDAQATQKATAYSLVAGITGALILGLGMSFCMVWTDALFVPGILTGGTGIAVLALAYPLYNRILRKERARIAPEILRLTEEMMK